VVPAGPGLTEMGYDFHALDCAKGGGLAKRAAGRHSWTRDIVDIWDDVLRGTQVWMAPVVCGCFVQARCTRCTPVVLAVQVTLLCSSTACIDGINVCNELSRFACSRAVVVLDPQSPAPALNHLQGRKNGEWSSLVQIASYSLSSHYSCRQVRTSCPGGVAAFEVGWGHPPPIP
jgi:hypothetical protein